MAKEISFSVDGFEFSTDEGQTILNAALDNGIYIPHLCHHPDLEPVGVCRLCGVELEGKGLVMSCVTPVEEGMALYTNTNEVISSRRVALELLIARHHFDCIACAARDNCALLNLASYAGVDGDWVGQLGHPKELMPVDSSNPFFTFDPNKCVLCGICVRTCNELQGRHAIDFMNRGAEATIGTFGNLSFIESVCESCGECVVRCPVGALAFKDYHKPAYQVYTVCSYCGVGCGLLLGVQGNELVNVEGDREAEVNRGMLCVKGRFGYDYVDHADRLTKPLVREYLLNGGQREDKADRGEWVEVDWDTALDLVADKLAVIKTESGPDAIGVLSSAKCTNEENYLMQKFARQVLGTHSVDHCARL